MKYKFKSTDDAINFIRFVITKIGTVKTDNTFTQQIIVEVTSISAIVTKHHLNDMAKQFGAIQEEITEES
jgi:hypothetical protein